MKNYSEPIITPDKDCYLRMMQEIKYRTEIIHLLINKDIDMIHPGVNNEVLALQIRMIIESISLASLAAHKNVFEEFSDKFRSFWRADKIFADIKKINPDFYPKPVTENYFTPPRVKNGIIVDRELIYRKDDFMTLDEMIDLHSKSCEFLHAQNPYSPIKDFRGFTKEVPNWIEKIEDLLHSHVIHLLNDKKLYLIHMKEKNKDSPTIYEATDSQA